MSKASLCAQVSLVCATAFAASSVCQAQTLSSNKAGTHDGFYYSFWKDGGDASFGLREAGRYTARWNKSTNNTVGGKGWNPGGEKIVNYKGSYNVDSSQNSYLALYGWTKNPLIEYYVIESYGSYNPSSCRGGKDYGSFKSDGATYAIRRCQRVQQPSIAGTQTFYQYFSVRTPKKGFGKISGTITVANHFAAWRSKGLNLGDHDYMVLATEGYNSQGSSDITVSEGASAGNNSSNDNSNSNSSNNNGSNNNSSNNSNNNNSNNGGNTSTPSGPDIIVRARGASGGEHINLIIGGRVVADWNLTTRNADYRYKGGAAGELQVEFDNDGGNRDVILDYVYVNGEVRQAEDMRYNTATFDGSCGGGAYSETMHCSGVIGFGNTDECLSDCGSANDSNSNNSSNNDSNSNNSSNNDSNSNNNNNSNNNSNNSGGSTSIKVRARGTAGSEHIKLKVGGNTVADWTLGTRDKDYTYSGSATGDIEVEFDNDSSGLDVILDYIVVNGRTLQAEDMRDNTATFDGSCGGGSYSETMHCNGVISFGSTQ